MPVTLRQREIRRILEGHIREAAEAPLDSDWCLTISRSREDGQLLVQIESRRSPAVLTALDGADIPDIEGLLQRLSAEACRGRKAYRR